VEKWEVVDWHIYLVKRVKAKDSVATEKAEEVA
jgi:hypothetical protein